MKNAMQLKAVIKNISKDKHISAQLVMQNFMLERLLERISVSKYHRNFILKGGFLIAAMVGLDTRATMDMDATIKGWPVNEESIKKMFLDICKIDLHDDITFEFKKIGEIREAITHYLQLSFFLLIACEPFVSVIQRLYPYPSKSSSIRSTNGAAGF